MTFTLFGMIFTLLGTAWFLHFVRCRDVHFHHRSESSTTSASRALINLHCDVPAIQKESIQLFNRFFSIMYILKQHDSTSLGPSVTADVDICACNFSNVTEQIFQLLPRSLPTQISNENLTSASVTAPISAAGTHSSTPGHATTTAATISAFIPSATATAVASKTTTAITHPATSTSAKAAARWRVTTAVVIATTTTTP